MQRNLAAAILLVVLCSDVGLCRRGSSSSKRNKKTSTSSYSRLPAPTMASAVSENLCYGGPMIKNVTLEPQDFKFYEDNWKDFPSGLYYPDCFSSLQPTMSKESHVNKCITFIITSNKLHLPEGRNSSDPKARVLWLVINYLCEEESCRQPCSGHGGLSYWGELLIISLVSCSVLVVG